MDCIIDDIKYARENGVSVECIFGLDKKNTSKDMLSKYLSLGCNIRYHLNEEGTKLESRLYAFENPDGDSYVYITGGKFSEGGISSNLAIIEEIKYSKDEKIEFSKVKAAIENGISNEEFETLTDEKLKELAATGDILARITERKIPSISQLYSQSSENNENVTVEYDESKESDYKDLLNKEVDIDIDMDDNIKVQDSLGEEVEHKIKNKEKVEDRETVITKIINSDKDINYDLMNTLIISVAKPTDDTEIKITSTITSYMFKFLGYPEEYHTVEDDKGAFREENDISLEIFTNSDSSQCVDSEAKLIQTAKATIIKSEKFKDIKVENDDIIRLIKNDNKKYRCEIIKKDTNEYNIWNEFCTRSCKGTTKKFGIM